MKTFTWVFKHYFKRNVRDISTLLNIALPVIFAIAFHLINNFHMGREDYIEASTPLNPLFILLVIGFQFFGAGNTATLLHADLKGAVRARLLVSGVDVQIFSLAVVMASWVFNVLQGIVVIAFTTLALGAQWGNYGIALVVLALIALMAQICGVIIFKYTQDAKTGSKVSYFFGEVMLGVAILPILVSTLAPMEAVVQYLPIGLSIHIIETVGLAYMGILLGQVALVATVAFFIRKGH